MRSNEAIAYITGFDINKYPRPSFIKHALGNSLRIYRLRTIIGYLRNKDRLDSTNVHINNYISDIPHYRKNITRVLPRIHDCVRIDRMDLSMALLIETSYLPFFRKIREDTMIILNTVGAFAAMKANKRIVIDLMDLWTCDPRGLRINALDYYVLKKAWQVWAWSKAIMILLRRIGISNVRYIPFGIDLNQFDPLKVSLRIFFDKYKDLEGKILIGYSGGAWFVNGEERIGIKKIIHAFKLIETEIKDDAVLILQTSKSIIPLIKKYGIKNYVFINQTKYNDPFRLSLLRALDVKILTSTKYLPVYLAERTTMFQYMTSGGAIIAERTPGTLGVLRHMYNAYMVDLDNERAMADAITYLINERKLRNYLGANARKDIETKYNIDIISRDIKRYLEI